MVNPLSLQLQVIWEIRREWEQFEAAAPAKPSKLLLDHLASVAKFKASQSAHPAGTLTVLQAGSPYLLLALTVTFGLISSNPLALAGAVPLGFKIIDKWFDKKRAGHKAKP